MKLFNEVYEIEKPEHLGEKLLCIDHKAINMRATMLGCKSFTKYTLDKGLDDAFVELRAEVKAIHQKISNKLWAERAKYTNQSALEEFKKQFEAHPKVKMNLTQMESIVDRIVKKYKRELMAS